MTTGWFVSGLVLAQLYLLGECCNLEAVNNCTNLLSANSQVFMLNDGISTVPSLEKLREMCGSLNEFKECYEPNASSCKSDVIFSMTFGTVEKVINYLCVDGFEDILRYGSCWNNSKVAERTQRCHERQKFMINDLKKQIGSVAASALKTRWCQILENKTACMSEAVVQGCGEAPACITRTLMDRALTGLSSIMKCPPPSPCVMPKNTEPNVTAPSLSDMNKPDTNTSTSDMVNREISTVRSSSELKTIAPEDGAATSNSAVSLLLLGVFVVYIFVKMAE